MVAEFSTADKFIWNGEEWVTLDYVPGGLAAHATTHAVGGTDVLTPAAIAAVGKTGVESVSDAKTFLWQLIGGFGAMGTGGVLDWNDGSNARAGGGYTRLAGNAANGPTPSSGEAFHPFSFEYLSKNGTGDLCQLAIPYRSESGSVYFRHRYLGVWSSWKSLVTATNGAITLGGSAQSDAPLRVRRGGDSFEFGHPNQSGYGSTVGAHDWSGSPFLAFNSEDDAVTPNTFLTRGIAGRVVMHNLGDSLLQMGRVTGANAAGQTPTKDLTIDSSGVVNAPIGLQSGGVAVVKTNDSRFVRSDVKATRTAGFSIPHGTSTAVSWDAEAFDNGGFHDLVTNPTRLTVPAGQAGLYEIGHTAGVAEGLSNTHRWISRMRKNGGDTGKGDAEQTGAGTNGGFPCNNGATILELIAGDYIELFVYQDSGAAKDLSATQSELWMRKLA